MFFLGYLLGRRPKFQGPQPGQSGWVTVIIVIFAFALMISFVTQFWYIAIPVFLIIWKLGIEAKKRGY